MHQNAQNILKDSEQTPLANTQTVEIAVTKEKQQRKKRKLLDSNGPVMKKKTMNIEEIMKKANILSEKDTHMALLSLLLIIWTKEFLLHITGALEILISLSLKEKQEPSTYVDALTSILFESPNNSEDRIRTVFLKEFGNHNLRQWVVHDVYGIMQKMFR